MVCSWGGADGGKGGLWSPLALGKRERDAERSGHVPLQPYGDGGCRIAEMARLRKTVRRAEKISMIADGVALGDMKGKMMGM